MDLKIEWLHTKPSPYWKKAIEARLNELQKGRQKIIHARVVLKKDQHHQSGADEVTIVLSVPQKVLTVSKTGETLGVAITMALDAIEQEWERYRERRQRTGQKRAVEGHPQGVIARLFKDRDYGFIEANGQGEVYFHKNSVRGSSFQSLRIGTQVEFDLEAGNEGPQASRVIIR